MLTQDRALLAHLLANSAAKSCCIITELTLSIPSSFFSEEYVGMNSVYGFCNGNVSAAVEKYRERFSQRIPGR
jgi:hypothetical protein